MIESPLNEPTIPELFSAPPESLSDAQFDRIIANFAEERHAWNKKEKAKAAAKGAPKVEKGSVKEISLSDLGL